MSDGERQERAVLGNLCGLSQSGKGAFVSPDSGGSWDSKGERREMHLEGCAAQRLGLMRSDGAALSWLLPSEELSRQRVGIVPLSDTKGVNMESVSSLTHSHLYSLLLTLDDCSCPGCFVCFCICFQS